MMMYTFLKKILFAIQLQRVGVSSLYIFCFFSWKYQRDELLRGPVCWSFDFWTLSTNSALSFSPPVYLPPLICCNCLPYPALFFPVPLPVGGENEIWLWKHAEKLIHSLLVSASGEIALHFVLLKLERRIPPCWKEVSCFILF